MIHFCVPICSLSIHRSSYSLSFNFRTKNADWVYEKLTAESLKGNKKGNRFRFKEDPEIEKIFRASLQDYRKSGYNRGHMAPAANHKASAKTLGDTFYLSNITPQLPRFNWGHWAGLEKHVRDLTRKYHTVEVITGPLFLPQEDRKGKRWVVYQVIGKNNVAVPTHYFKVIFLKGTKGRKKTKAYILPHRKISSKIPLSHFKTTVEKVESVAGIKFFPSTSPNKS